MRAPRILTKHHGQRPAATVVGREHFGWKTCRQTTQPTGGNARIEKGPSERRAVRLWTLRPTRQRLHGYAAPTSGGEEPTCHMSELLAYVRNAGRHPRAAIYTRPVVDKVKSMDFQSMAALAHLVPKVNRSALG